MSGKEVIIKVSNLVKKYGSFIANDNLSFEVYKGEIFGFIGANGAGKTTAIRILCGLSYPTSGEIEVAGYNVFTQREKIKSVIGYITIIFSALQHDACRPDITAPGFCNYIVGDIVVGITPYRGIYN